MRGLLYEYLLPELENGVLPIVHKRYGRELRRAERKLLFLHAVRPGDGKSEDRLNSEVLLPEKDTNKLERILSGMKNSTIRFDFSIRLVKAFSFDYVHTTPSRETVTK